MKKLFILPFITMTSMAFSQIGINTPTPQATFDIRAKHPTALPQVIIDNPEGLLIPRVDRERAQTMKSIVKSTLIYVDSIATGSQSGLAINIDEVGYYQFDGKNWIKLNPNIYNSNGTLSENRTVTQGDKTLAFTANVKNAFSVDGSTFSVNAANNRVGINTIDPQSILAVANNTPGGLVDAFSAGINNCGSACGQGTARNITLFNGNKSNSLFATIDFIPSLSSSGITGAAITGIDRDEINNYAGLQFSTRNSANYGARLTIKASGNIGIGTAAPTTKLDVFSATQGAVKITDGTQGEGKVLTSDANGVATWKQTASTFGTVNVAPVDYTLPADSNMAKYVGVPITLPPGKWLLSLSIGIEHPNKDATSTDTNFIRFRLGDSTADINSFISDSMIPKFTSQGFIRSMKKGMVNGNLAVNNTSGANKTYYLFVDNYNSDGEKYETIIRLGWNETSITYQKIQ